MIYLTLFLEFLKIGCFTFGGGYSMIPFVKETVLTHSWLSEAEFVDMIGISEMTPGPIAINMATYIGSSQGMLADGYIGAFFGALLATIGVALPAFLIMLLIAIVLKRFMKNRFVQGVLKGITPVALALISSSGLILFCDVILNVNYDGINTSWSPNSSSLLIFLLIVISTFFAKKALNKKINPVFIIILSSIIGLATSFVFEGVI